MRKMFFNILATFAEFEADLIRLRTREGMAVARARGKLKGKQPKLSDRQQKELRRMHDTGDYSTAIWPSCSRCPARRCTAPSAGRRPPHSAEAPAALVAQVGPADCPHAT